MYQQLKYSKIYQNETEDRHRMAIFLENRDKIDVNNRLFGRGLVGYKMGINKYSDLSADEFRSQMTGHKSS